MMWRLVFTICSAVSLLLCIAACVLWVRSNSVGDTVLLQHHQPGPSRGVLHFVQFWSGGGGLRVGVGRITTIDPVHLAVHESHPFLRWSEYDLGPKPYPLDRSDRGSGTTFAGVQIYLLDYAIATYDEWFLSLTVPYALIIAMAAVPPVVWARRAIRSRHRARVGLCMRCGYDLRAATSRECPECGAAQPVARWSPRIPRSPCD